MTFWRYALIPLYPVIGIICLLTLAYERLILNEQESVENSFTATRILFNTWNVILTILGFPAVLLGSFGGIIRWPLIIVFSPILLLWGFIRNFLFDPIFRTLVPAAYYSWNNRVYQSLQNASQQIRVLEVLPGPPSTGIKARLIVIDLNSDSSHHQYEALSYSWGGHLVLRRLITLSDRPYFVTDTVFNALKELRHPEKPRQLWIDAICINQGDLKEKDKQILLMGSIYLSAQRAIVWLGKASPKLDIAFQLMHDSAIEEAPEIESIGAKHEDWHAAIVALMHARWWSRVWIVQEVSLPKTVVIRCGHNKIRWDVMGKCFEILSKVPNHGLDKKVLEFVNVVAELRKSRLHHEKSILELAIRFRDRVAGDPRDKLRGYRGLSPRSAMLLIPEKSSSKTAADLFSQFSINCINETGSLAIMAAAEGLAVHKNTWAIDWEKMTSPQWKDNDPAALDNIPEHPPPAAFWNGDLLPSISSWTGKRYSATQSLKAVCKKDKTSVDSLCLTGWVEDLVEQRGDLLDIAHETAKIIRSWERLAGGPWKNKTDPRCVRFIKTLVADTWYGSLPSDWPERLQPSVTTPASQRGNLDDADEPQEPNQDLSSIRPLIYACCWRRRFFITRKGRFGLGPASITGSGFTQVCLLLGSDVPFVLLPPMFGGSSHHFLGQAFVEGMMEYTGNLQDDLDTKAVETQEFLIK